MSEFFWASSSRQSVLNKCLTGAVFLAPISSAALSWMIEPTTPGRPHGERKEPAIAAGPRPGDFRLVWQGNKDGNIADWNTYYRRTTDGGATWEAIVKLSDRTRGAPYKHPAGYTFPYGDYCGLAVDRNGTNHAIWGEGISYDGPGGSWYTRSH